MSGGWREERFKAALNSGLKAGERRKRLHQYQISWVKQRWSCFLVLDLCYCVNSSWKCARDATCLTQSEVSWSNRKPFVRKGHPYSISRGLRPNFKEVFLTCSKALGRRVTQGSGVSWDGFLRYLLIMFIFSTFPEDWGLRVQWKWYCMPSAFETAWVTAALIKGLLSLWTIRLEITLPWIVSYSLGLREKPFVEGIILKTPPSQ